MPTVANLTLSLPHFLALVVIVAIAIAMVTTYYLTHKSNKLPISPELQSLLKRQPDLVLINSAKAAEAIAASFAAIDKAHTVIDENRGFITGIVADYRLSSAINASQADTIEGLLTQLLGQTPTTLEPAAEPASIDPNNGSQQYAAALAGIADIPQEALREPTTPVSPSQGTTPPSQGTSASSAPPSASSTIRRSKLTLADIGNLDEARRAAFPGRQ